MGKNKRKQNWKDKREPSKQIKNEKNYQKTEFSFQNPRFEAFYYMQLKQDFKDKSEYQLFLNTLKMKLPVTFRINSTIPNYHNFLKIIKDPHFVPKMLNLSIDQDDKIQEKDEIVLRNIKWYPDNLVWELNTCKSEFKKNKDYQKLHKYILNACESGLLSRQELVSMIPPLLLDIKSTDLIFDMCAAPGSKTAQLLELIYKDEFQKHILTEGGVVANDVDYSRASMLTHQIQRINTTGMMVVNHAAQYFPTLHTNIKEQDSQIDTRLYFDKILADVPCTGDGAIRKLPKKWNMWTANDGNCLHPLQLQILMRAMQLVKIGGLVLYSTCSLNPIEDEAVITELFRRSNKDSFELVDLTKMLPDLIKRPGVHSWIVCEEKSKKPNNNENQLNAEAPQDYFNIFANASELPQDYKGYIKPSMFPDTLENMRDVYKLHHTIRILPHDQNTGGFYLALLRKKDHIIYGQKPKTLSAENQNPTSEIIVDDEQQPIREIKTVAEYKLSDDSDEENDNEEQKEETKEEIKEPENNIAILQSKQNQKSKPKGKSGYIKEKGPVDKKETWIEFNSPKWEWIKNYYGFDESLNKFMIWQNEGDKKILWVTPGIKKILDADINKGAVNKLNMGAKLLAKNKNTLMDDACPYRICQDALLSILPYMKKRKIKCTNKDFKFFITKTAFKHEEIPNEDLRKEIIEMGEGALAIYSENEKQNENDNNNNHHNFVNLDCLACLNFKKSITIMVSKELIESLKIRYL